MNWTTLNLLMILPGAVLAVEGPAWAKDRDLGRIEYQSKCALCHGMDGKGNGPFASQLKTAPTDLTQLAKKNGGVFPQSAVEKTIDGTQEVAAHGPRDMPIWVYRFHLRREAAGQKTRQDALVDYLNRIQEK